MLVAAIAVAAMGAVAPAALEAQRRPGVGMGFYTYTGLLSGELEGGSVVASTSLIEAPWVALSAVGTVPLLRMRKKAWIAALRVTPLNLGNRGSCYVTPETTGCQDNRFEERAAFMTGGAFDIRSSLLRVMAGPAYVGVENRDARLGAVLRVVSGPAVRADLARLADIITVMDQEVGILLQELFLLPLRAI